LRGSSRRVAKVAGLVGGNPGIACANAASDPMQKSMKGRRNDRMGWFSRTENKEESARSTQFRNQTSDGRSPVNLSLFAAPNVVVDNFLCAAISELDRQLHAVNFGYSALTKLKMRDMIANREFTDIRNMGRDRR
jgi:hypothetical protein